LNLENKKIGITAIALVSMIGIVGVLMLDPIAQDIEYHLFRDQRTMLNIPNFWNVISNLPFLLVGVMGLHSIRHSRSIRLIAEMRTAYILLFVGVSLVAFGSGYYHLWPSNGTLVWDRLPMTIAFMALFSVIIAEFTSVQLGKFALWPLIIFGAFSVIYWHFTEARGEGDLRLYALVQFLPMMVIPLILLFFKSRFTCTSGYWLLLCAYVLAKAFEYFDEAIYNLLSLFSGHSLKHVVVAFGILFLLKAYNNREPT
jgi:hypothetical protein